MIDTQLKPLPFAIKSPLSSIIILPVSCYWLIYRFLYLGHRITPAAARSSSFREQGGHWRFRVLSGGNMTFIGIVRWAESMSVRPCFGSQPAWSRDMIYGY